MKRCLLGVGSVMVSFSVMGAALTPDTMQTMQQQIERERKPLFAKPLTVSPQDRLPTDRALNAEQQRIEGERRTVFSTTDRESTFPDVPMPKRVLTT